MNGLKARYGDSGYNVTGLFVKNQNENCVGLPKSPVDVLQVRREGAVGDFNNYRQESLEGTLDRALLIMTDDALFSLQNEGWPVTPGSMGENILLNVPYFALAIGSVYALGNDVQVEIIEPAEPCHKLGHLVEKGELKRFIKACMNRRGWYARVGQPGQISMGDPVYRL